MNGYGRGAIAWRSAFVMALALSGCGGAEAASRRTVFDPSIQGTNVVAVGSVALERPIPALDAPTPRASEPLVGVSVLNDAVRFSRPNRWMIRDASNEAGHEYIHYVSPRAYSFAIYALSDAPTDSWRDILQRYEVDVAAAGGKIVGQRIATATSANQGRAYTIERKVETSRSRSRELILRGARSVALVQIVTQDDTLSRIGGELLEVLKRLEVR